MAEGKIESSVVVIDQPTKHLSPSPKIEFHLSLPSSGCNRIGFLIIGYNLSNIFQIIKVFDLCGFPFEFDGGESVKYMTEDEGDDVETMLKAVKMKMKLV
ncbi:unnamed protein product [Lactuca virosa]|uniref:Uncharacterized protein n=1 Tax=Lactuca virosa TaxID=75947 RepID=A0AAU9LY65_9ASTR|nr:unnamed protein product [Lactuca virosa]